MLRVSISVRFSASRDPNWPNGNAYLQPLPNPRRVLKRLHTLRRYGKRCDVSDVILGIPRKGQMRNARSSADVPYFTDTKDVVLESAAQTAPIIVQ